MRRQKRVAVIMVTPLLLLGTALAKKAPKTYPEEGKVIAMAVNELPVTTYTHTGGANGGTTVPVRTIKRTRTYTVQTETKTYELDCGKAPHMFSTKLQECGGDKKLQIGDTVHFRIENGWAYIPAPEGTDAAQEQKLRVLNEDLKTEPAGGENEKP